MFETYPINSQVILLLSFSAFCFKLFNSGPSPKCVHLTGIDMLSKISTINSTLFLASTEEQENKMELTIVYWGQFFV